MDAKIIKFVPEEKKINLSIKALLPRPEYEPRHEHEEAPAKDAQGGRRPRKNNRRGGNAEFEEGDEYREWTEGGYGGASIADLLGGNDEENK